MSVSHARVPSSSLLPAPAWGEQVPGLLAVLAQVADPRRKRGRRFTLVFVLAVAVVCVLAGARGTSGRLVIRPRTFPKKSWARRWWPHPLRRKIAAPSEKRIRTLLQDLDGDALDVIIRGWLRALAASGRLDGLLTAIAIDGKWLRGVADGQVKLFAAMLHEEKTVIAQHRIPDDTNEITQVRELLDPVDLTDTVITADAAHAQHDTAAYIAGEKEADYLLTVKASQPGLQREIQPDQRRTRRRPRPRRHGLQPRADHQALHLGHRRRRR